MTTSVDVLAVMARDAADAFSQRRDDEEIQAFLHRESMEARAAVAELIEAATEYRSGIASLRPGLTNSLAMAQYRFDAALSRVKGA